MLIEINNQTKSRINLSPVKRTTERFLQYYKKRSKEVSIAFIGDKRMRQLNRDYRRKDKITDILSFIGEDGFLGEIVIDFAQIKRQAKQNNKSINDELIFILVHGLLHLIGYDDETEKGRLNMIKLGEIFINKLKS